MLFDSSKKNAMLMVDFYKLTHMMQFDKRITGFYSYLVPRSNRTVLFNNWTMFGLQTFVNDLADIFEKYFFKKPWNKIENEIKEVLVEGLYYNEKQVNDTTETIRKLYSKGYLPITINGVKEGENVPIGCPAIEIVSVDPDVPWIGQAIESWLSCAIWHPSISATVAKEYAKIAKKAYDKSSDKDYHTSMCDFSMRGQESYGSAVMSSAGWLTAFYNSSTVEARRIIQDNYLDDCPAYGLTSTEHSVMTSDAILNDMNERETYRRLLTDVYPHTSFAAVCDSYDFWNVVTNILPSLRDEIEAHEGFIGVRHDSSEPVTALTGIPTFLLEEVIPSDIPFVIKSSIRDIDKDILENMLIPCLKNCDFILDYVGKNKSNFKIRIVDDINKSIDMVYQFSKISDDWDFSFSCSYGIQYLGSPTCEDKGMVEVLYEEFGGNTNSKGFITLNPKVKAVYGDSITIQRAKEIYDRLIKKGFAADNVSLGVGSFSMQCLEEHNKLKPFTRDTFSIAIKATYMEYMNPDTGEIKGKPIYKDPKGFSQKRSLKGIANVRYNKDGKLEFADGYTKDSVPEKTAFVTYFMNGKVCGSKFQDVRNLVDEKVKESVENE